MLERIKNEFKNIPQSIVGAFQDENCLYLVKIEEKENGWNVTGVVSELTGNWFSGEENSEPGEAVRLCCQKNGFLNAALSVAIAREKVFSYEKEFPLPLPPEPQQSEMFRLDILVNSPFESYDWWWSAVPVGPEGRFLLAAMDRSSGENLCRSFAVKGHSLSAICLEQPEYEYQLGDGVIDFAGQQLQLPESVAAVQWNHGLLTALMAAVSLTGKGGYNFLPEEKQPERFAWGKLTRMVAGGAAIFCLALFLGNVWKIEQVGNKLQVQQEQLQLVSADREKMRQLQQAKAECRKANEIMVELSKSRRSYYGLLLYLGMAQTDGIYLSEISTDATGNIYLQGQGSNFELVNSFVGTLREEKELFKEAPQLEKTEIGNQGTVKFKLKGIIR